MKRLLVFICFILLPCLAAFSQTYSDSTKMVRDYVVQNSDKFLTVKGLELKPGLKMEDALKYLSNKGWQKSELFETLKGEYGVYDLRGSFFGRSNCRIKILPSSDKNVVGAIGINFPDATSFKQLKKEYDELKSALSEKYYLFESQEKFDDNYVGNSTSDYLKLTALERDEALFETRYHALEGGLSMLLGFVLLKINHIKVNYETSYFISLTYVTSDNVVEQLSSAKDDL